MEPGAGSPESEVPLRVSCVGGNGHLESGGEPEPRHNGRKCNYKKCTIVLAVALAVVSLGLLITGIVLAVLPSKLPSSNLYLPTGPACPDGWMGYRGKCYYYSEREGSWTYDQSHCSAFNASLAGIDSEQEMKFLLRYKDAHDHWIGLQRERGQPWKWANGTKFNNTFVIRGGGDCAYLNDENGVSSSRCYIARRWICSKPEVYVMGKRDCTGRELEISLLEMTLIPT